MKENDNQRRETLAKVSAYVESMLAAPYALRGQQLRGGGPVAEFERELAARCGFPFCLATSNATTALLISALAADLPSREIIVAPNSWGGTFGPFEFAGAKLVKARADENGNICPESIRDLVSTRTAAVLATDWGGVRHAAHEVRVICDSLGLLYIEDSAWLPGVTAPLANSSVADVQIISFGPGKPMSLGEGGALLTRHEEIYERAVALSQHPERAMSEHIDEFPALPFLNGRIHPLAAVIGCAFLSATNVRTPEVSSLEVADVH